MTQNPLCLALAAAAALALTAGCDSPRATISRVDLGAYAGDAGAAALTADGLLTARLQAMLADDPITREADIHVSVAQARVRLSGFVDSAATKLRAGVLAAEIEGVEGVDNRLIQRHHAGVVPDPLGGARVHL